MLSNYYTLSYLASTLNSKLQKIVILEAFSQKKEELAIRLSPLGSYLLILCNRVINTLYLQDEFSRARANSADVLKASWGDKITEVFLKPKERVIIFRLGSGLEIHAQFFGPKANVLLVDGGGLILDSFKDAKDLVGQKPSYRSAELGHDPLVLQKLIEQHSGEAIRKVIKRSFPELGATLISEILFRASIPKDSKAGVMHSEDIRRLTGAVEDVLRDVAVPQPRVYCRSVALDQEVPEVFSIVPLHHLQYLKEKSFDDVHQAIRFFVSRKGAYEAIEKEKGALRNSLQNRADKLRRTISAIEGDLKESRRAEEFQQFGNLLIQNLENVSTGMSEVVLGGSALTIPLKPELSGPQNAQRYFDKAKKVRTTQRQSEKRLKNLQARLSITEHLLGDVQALQTKEDVRAFMASHSDELKALGLRVEEKHKEPPFRIFTVDGGFQVWAGKSSANNDLLTLKHTKPNDLWFHARGSGGSHVVLKTASGKGEPTKKAKEQAAGIAAYYSRMHKARMVPVTMTEKKYVRKPKGAPPGTVTVDREKVIFAEPRLPEVDN